MVEFEELDDVEGFDEMPLPIEYELKKSAVLNIKNSCNEIKSICIGTHRRNYFNINSFFRAQTSIISDNLVRVFFSPSYMNPNKFSELQGFVDVETCIHDESAVVKAINILSVANFKTLSEFEDSKW